MKIVNTFLFIFLVLANCATVVGQHREDQHWIFTNYIHFDFDPHGLQTEIIAHPGLGLVTGICNTAISNTQGELQFHSSGCNVRDRDSYVMMNGDSLSPGLLEIGYCEFGDAIWYQNLTAIPVPGSATQYFLFTLDGGILLPPEDSNSYITPFVLYYHRIDMAENNGLGKVIEKHTIAVQDTLAGGFVQACRHANGRDWWIVVPEWNSNCYYSILISATGASTRLKHCSGPVHGEPTWGSSVDISPDGNWYARSYSWLPDTLGQADLYSFDRCTGELTHVNTLSFATEFPNYSGVCFSPGSRYLYVTNYKSLLQYDLLAPDIQQSLVVAGTIDHALTMDKASLYYPKTGPDGRIYIASPGGHKYLSIIHNPDHHGPGCNFRAHDLQLPMNRSNFHGLPNHPDFRLGPVDDSACDSLNIDNLPVAYFRYEADAANPLLIYFTNLSAFEPAAFEWSYGDQVISEDYHTSHNYPIPGVYTVCLEASNLYGSDTFCLEVALPLTGNQQQTNLPFTIFPNPATDILQIQSAETTGLLITIHDMLGRIAMRSVVSDPPYQINVSNLIPGMYALEIQNLTGSLQVTVPITISRHP